MEAASFARPLPRFEYVPTTGCEPSHRHATVVSHRHSEVMREASHANRDGWLWERTETVPLRLMPNIVTAQAKDGFQSQPRL